MAIEKKTRYSAVCDGCSLRAPVTGWPSSSTVSTVWYEDLTELMSDLTRDYDWLFDWDQCWCPKCKVKVTMWRDKCGETK